MKIIKNAIRCKICGDEIESTYRHDYVTCRCGACSVDGGHNYLRRSFKSPDCFEDISIVVPAAEAKVCPYCNVKLEEKSAVYCEENGSYEVLAHCNECLRTWRWVVDAEGKSTDLEQYFFG